MCSVLFPSSNRKARRAMFEPIRWPSRVSRSFGNFAHASRSSIRSGSLSRIGFLKRSARPRMSRAAAASSQRSTSTWRRSNSRMKFEVSCPSKYAGCSCSTRPMRAARDFGSALRTRTRPSFLVGQDTTRPSAKSRLGRRRNTSRRWAFWARSAKRTNHVGSRFKSVASSPSASLT